jgi:TFIIF-interacting CTD phosphatase-like protein
MKFYVKDLGILEDCCDLKDVVLIDNSVLSFAYHLDNGIPISPFYDSKNDCELLDISNFLLKYADEDDIRDRLREVYKLNEYLEIIKNYSSEDSFTGSSSISIVQEDEEGEKTNKNNNKYMELNLSKSSKNNTIHEKEEDSLDIKDNNTFYLNDKIKNCSQSYFKFKEIIDLFDNEEQNEKKSKSFSHREKRYKKLESKSNIYINKNIDKSWCLVKRKNKNKSLRSIDINFKKEWDEKQKELNNNK